MDRLPAPFASRVRPLTQTSPLVIGVGLAEFSSIRGFGDEGEEPLNPSGYYFV
jgi:hypothetical protein